MVVGGGGRESDYIVCPRPLLQFLQFFQFMSDRLHQVTSVYVGGTGHGARQQMKGNIKSIIEVRSFKIFLGLR